MADIKKELNDIKNAVYGKEVRGSIHDGIKKINEEVEDSTETSEQAKHQVENIQEQVNNLVVSGDSSVEAAQARVDKDNHNYSTLKERLDTEQQQFETQLAQTQEELYLRTMDFISLDKDLKNGDITQELKELVSSSREMGKGLYIPNGSYRVSDDIIVKNLDNIIIDGELVFEDGFSLILIGKRGKETQNVEINKVKGKVRVSGFYNSIIKILSATELELFADSENTEQGAQSYCSFHLGRVEKLVFNGVNNGWINGNTFFGGRITDSIHIDGEYAHNDNTFYSTMLENVDIYLGNCRYNNFYDVRFEGEINLEFGETAYGNKFFRQWFQVGEDGAFDTVFPKMNYIDNGVGNDVLPASLDFYRVEHILDMNLNTKNYNPETFKIENGELRIRGGYREVVSSGIIPLNTSFGVNFESSEAAFRFRVYLFDEDKQPIQEDVDGVVSGNSIYFNAIQGRYENGANLSRARITVRKKGDYVKYIRVEVLTGNETANRDFDYVNVSVIGKKTDPLLGQVIESMRLPIYTLDETV